MTIFRCPRLHTYSYETRTMSTSWSSCNTNFHLIGIFATYWKYCNSKFGSHVPEPAAHVQTLEFLVSVLFLSRKSRLISDTEPIQKSEKCVLRTTPLEVWRNDRYLRHRLIRFLSRHIARTRSPIQSQVIRLATQISGFGVHFFDFWCGFLTRDLKRVCAGIKAATFLFLFFSRPHFGQNTGWVFIEAALTPH